MALSQGEIEIMRRSPIRNYPFQRVFLDGIKLEFSSWKAIKTSTEIILTGIKLHFMALSKDLYVIIEKRVDNSYNIHICSTEEQ